MKSIECQEFAKMVNDTKGKSGSCISYISGFTRNEHHKMLAVLEREVW